MKKQLATALYKIDKNVPFAVKQSAIKFPFHDMAINDSFFVPANDLNGARISSACNYFQKVNPGFKFKTRRVEELGKQGVRVWRIEPKADEQLSR